jgi:aminopeptidase 2
MPIYSSEPCDPGEEFDHLFRFPEDEGEDEDDDVGFAWKITRFETTPLMSTYLVAYANGEFQHLESTYRSPLSGRTVPLRIYSKHQWRHSSVSVQEGNLCAQRLPRIYPTPDLRSN